MLHYYPMGYTKKLHTDHVHKLGFADPEHTKINTKFSVDSSRVLHVPFRQQSPNHKKIPNPPGSPGHHPPLPPTLRGHRHCDTVASLKVKSMSETSAATLRKALPKACGRPASVGMPTWRVEALEQPGSWIFYPQNNG